MNGGGQFSYESSIGCERADFEERGKGTDGGLVVHRKAAKYRHNAGPKNKFSRWSIYENQDVTCDHEITLCTREHIRIEEAFCFSLCE